MIINILYYSVIYYSHDSAIYILYTIKKKSQVIMSLNVSPENAQRSDCYHIVFQENAPMISIVSNMIGSQQVEEYVISNNELLIGFHNPIAAKTIYEIPHVVRLSVISATEFLSLTKKLLNGKSGCFISPTLGPLITKLKINPLPIGYDGFLDHLIRLQDENHQLNLGKLSTTYINRNIYIDFHPINSANGNGGFQAYKKELINIGKTIMRGIAKTTIQLAKTIIEEVIS